MIPTVEDILRELASGDMTYEKALFWINQHLRLEADTQRSSPPNSSDEKRSVAAPPAAQEGLRALLLDASDALLDVGNFVLAKRLTNAVHFLPAAQEAPDTVRLEWLMHRVSGREFRRLGVDYPANCDRAAIDAALAAQEAPPSP